MKSSPVRVRVCVCGGVGGNKIKNLHLDLLDSHWEVLSWFEMYILFYPGPQV